MKIIKILFLTIITLNLCCNLQAAQVLINQGLHKKKIMFERLPAFYNKELFDAVIIGDIKELQKLLNDKLINIDAKSEFDETALMVASVWGQIIIVEILLNHGAEINMKNRYGETALILASACGHKAVAKLLLDRGAVLNMKTKYESTALITASREGRTETVKLLLDYGAEINIQENNGYTALMWALINNEIEVVKLLLDHPDININIKEKCGMDALDLVSACKKVNQEVKKLIETYQNEYLPYKGEPKRAKKINEELPNILTSFPNELVGIVREYNYMDFSQFLKYKEMHNKQNPNQ